jgi:hypothetical protein
VFRCTYYITSLLLLDILPVHIVTRIHCMHIRVPQELAGSLYPYSPYQLVDGSVFRELDLRGFLQRVAYAQPDA